MNDNRVKVLDQKFHFLIRKGAAIATRLLHADNPFVVFIFSDKRTTSISAPFFLASIFVIYSPYFLQPFTLLFRFYNNKLALSAVQTSLYRSNYRESEVVAVAPIR